MGTLRGSTEGSILELDSFWEGVANLERCHFGQLIYLKLGLINVLWDRSMSWVYDEERRFGEAEELTELFVSETAGQQMTQVGEL